MPVKTIIGIIAAALLGVTAGALLVREPDFHAIVEPNGTVLLCVIKRDILFADRCAGAGRLTIVHPIQEGEIIWRTAYGRIGIKNDTPQDRACAVSRAIWDRTSEDGGRSSQARRPDSGYRACRRHAPDRCASLTD